MTVGTPAGLVHVHDAIPADSVEEAHNKAMNYFLMRAVLFDGEGPPVHFGDSCFFNYNHVSVKVLCSLDLSSSDNAQWKEAMEKTIAWEDKALKDEEKEAGV